MTDLSVSSDEMAHCEGLERVVIGNDKERYLQVGNQLPLPEKKELLSFLKDNLNIFP